LVHTIAGTHAHAIIVGITSRGDRALRSRLRLFAIYLSHRQLSAKVRSFVDYLVETIGRDPLWGVVDVAKAEQRGPLDRFAGGT
jgi:hypothetical protein